MNGLLLASFDLFRIKTRLPTMNEATTHMAGHRDDMSGKSSRRGSRLLQSSPNAHDPVPLRPLEIAATDGMVNHYRF